MQQNRDKFSKHLTFSIVFLIIGLIFSVSVIFFFIFGLPIGLFFISLSIWYFAMWRFKREIPLKGAVELFALPIMGIYAILRQTLQIPQTGLEGLIFWTVSLIVVFYFFTKIKG